MTFVQQCALPSSVKQKGDALQHASARLKDDEGCVLAAVKQKGDALQHASARLKDDEGCKLAAQAPNIPPASASSTTAAAPTTSAPTSKASVLLSPVHLGESIFALKAATTQLVSVVVMLLVLVPFYKLGFGWWGEGAGHLLGGVLFDLPQLRLQFAVLLSWPEFQQPRLAVAFAVGLLLAALQQALRLGKWVLWRFGTRHAGVAQIGVVEARLEHALALTSWLPSRFASDLLQSAIDVAWAERGDNVGRALKFLLGKNELQDKNTCSYVARSAAATCAVAGASVGGCIPLFVATMRPREKVFGASDGDVEVEEFCSSEQSMGFRSASCTGNMQVVKALATLGGRCPWIVHVDFSGCENLESDIAVFKNTPSLLKINLSDTSCKGESQAVGDLIASAGGEIEPPWRLARAGGCFSAWASTIGPVPLLDDVSANLPCGCSVCQVTLPSSPTAVS